MNPITDIITRASDLHARVGTVKMAALAGVAASTISDASGRGFRNKSTRLLERLAVAVEADQPKETT